MGLGWDYPSLTSDAIEMEKTLVERIFFLNSLDLNWWRMMKARGEKLLNTEKEGDLSSGGDW